MLLAVTSGTLGNLYELFLCACQSFHVIVWFDFDGILYNLLPRDAL